MPTRTGYSFVGWRGRNLIYPYKYSLVDYAESFSVNGEKITLNTKVNTTGSHHEGTVVINIEDLSVGKYFFSIESASYTGEQNLADIAVCGWTIENKSAWVSYVDGAEPCIWYTTGKYKTIFDFDGYAGGVAFASGRFYVGFTTSNGTSFGSASATLENVFLTKISSENEVVKYEPYYIESSTVFGTPGDRTLVAEWVESSKNLFVNGDFEDVYTQTDTGWDTTLNGTLHATSWDDYNPAVDNPEVGYHAHIKDLSATDPLHGHVYEYNAVDTRWLGISQILNLSNGTFMFTAQVYRVSGANRMRAAAWYSRASDGVGTHGSTNRIFLEEMAVGKWVTVRGYFTIDDNMNSRFEYYFYGSESGVGIFYLDNVFLTQIS